MSWCVEKPFAPLLAVWLYQGEVAEKPTRDASPPLVLAFSIRLTG